jgi:putative spermidine/putrescine transport system ATP-binding protein
MADLQLEGLTKRYGQTVALDGFSLHVAKGELMSLLGPSGCGKTTALRIIAGFIRPTAGVVRIDGQVANEVLPHHRDIGMVFQNYALFPHMTVWQNVAFGLTMRRVSPKELERRVGEVLELVRLTGLEQRYPSQLSGGQQQRVAVARAVVINPTVLLLDEPLSNLDAKLRVETREELRRLQREVGVTTIFVTHDQEEALTISDRVAVMQSGKLEQVGTPEELYNRPQSLFVASFIGSSNLWSARVAEVDSSRITVELAETALKLQVDREPANLETRRGHDVAVVVRPERVAIGPVGAGAQTPNTFGGRISSVTFVGAVTRYNIQIDHGPDLRAEVANVDVARWSLGDAVQVSWSPANVVLIPLDVPADGHSMASAG